MSGPEAPANDLAFVDSIESGLAKLLLRDENGDWKAYLLPASVLPKQSREGMWLRLTFEPSAPPSDQASEQIRKNLSAKDDGGDFSL